MNFGFRSPDGNDFQTECLSNTSDFNMQALLAHLVPAGLRSFDQRAELKLQNREHHVKQI